MLSREQRMNEDEMFAEWKKLQDKYVALEQRAEAAESNLADAKELAIECDRQRAEAVQRCEVLGSAVDVLESREEVWSEAHEDILRKLHNAEHDRADMLAALEAIRKQYHLSPETFGYLCKMTAAQFAAWKIGEPSDVGPT